MGGDNTPQMITPTQPPSAPTYGATLDDYIKNFPKLLDLEKQYGPELAQLQYQLAQQYTPQYAQMMQGVEQQLYPQTSQLQEQVAGQALQGLSSQMPDYMAQQYMSDMNAGIGANANAPIGVSARSTGLMNLQQDWKKYYQNLALTTAGRQPLTQVTIPSTQSASSGLGNALTYSQGTYGSYVGAFPQQTLANAYQSALLPQGTGTGIGSLTGFFGGVGKGFLGGGF